VLSNKIQRSFLIIQGDSSLPLPSDASQYSHNNAKSAVVPYSDVGSRQQLGMTRQLLELRKTTRSLKEEIKELKKQQVGSIPLQVSYI